MASLSRAAPPVVVVGAGVSGTVAALTIADAGRRVLLLNSALDAVGMPGYGPALRLPHASSASTPAQVLASAASGIAPSGTPPGAVRMWAEDACSVRGRNDVLLVDRRLVSLHTKWLVENHPLVDVRQALVTGVGGVSRLLGSDPLLPCAVTVETVFGETLLGAACVLAVGLGLQGRIRVGEVEMAGGRYGEVGADALWERLERGGAEARIVETSVGARVTWSGERTNVEVLEDLGTSLCGEIVALDPVADASAVRADASAIPFRPPGLPPLPEHSPEVCWPPTMALLVPDVTKCEARSALPQQKPVRPLPDGETVTSEGVGLPGRNADREMEGVWPDGVATGEWYVSAGLDVDCLRHAVRVVRPGHRIGGRVLRLLPDGGLPGYDGVWVCGQAAGATSYVDSLNSGVRVARVVVDALAAS